MSDNYSGLDRWITEGPRLHERPECRDCGSAFLAAAPTDLICDECRVSECDVCGEAKSGCVDTWAYGMEVHACPKCCSNAEDDDPAEDRACWKYHQRRG